MVAGERSQGVVLDDLRGDVEDDGPQAGNDPHQRGEPQEPELAPKAILSKLQKLGDPAGNGHSGGPRKTKGNFFTLPCMQRGGKPTPPEPRNRSGVPSVPQRAGTTLAR